MSAALAATARLYTVEDLEGLPSGDRYELLEGELTMPPMPGARHGSTANTLAVYAGLFVIDNELGECFAAETRFILSRNPDTALGPDWAFVARERLPNPLPERSLELAPDVVLEVRSPGDTPREIMDKVGRWLAAGVRLVWELNPRTETMTVYRHGHAPVALGIDDTLSGEDVLPGFSLPIRRLFKATKGA